jgi:hypothetical protein
VRNIIETGGKLGCLYPLTKGRPNAEPINSYNFAWRYNQHWPQKETI